MSVTGTRPTLTRTLVCRRAFRGAVPILFVALDAVPQEAPAATSASPPSSYALVLFGCLFLFLAWCVGALRWKWILDASGLRLKYGFLLQTWISADFLNRLVLFMLPIPPLGATYRFAQTARVSRESMRPAVVIVIEKACGLVSVAALFAVLFPLALFHLEIDLARFRFLLAGAAFLVAFSVLAASLFRPRVLWLIVSLVVSQRKARPTLAKLLKAFSIFEGKTLKVVQIVLLGIALHGLTILYLGTLLYAVATSDMGRVTSLMTSVVGVFQPLSEWCVAQARPSALSEPIAAIQNLAAVEVTQTIGLIIVSGVSGTFFVVQLFRFVLGKPEAVEVRRLDNLVQDHRLTFGAARDFRRYVMGISAAAVGGGLMGGAIVGLSEALWVYHLLGPSEELRLLSWGPLFYGPLLVPFGIAAGWVAGFLNAAQERHLRTSSICMIALAATLTACIIVIGRFRYVRDVLGEGTMSTGEGLAILGSAIGIGLLVAVGGILLMRKVNLDWRRITFGASSCYLTMILIGGVLGRFWAVPPGSSAQPPGPPGNPDVPNVIFVAVDTLRSDYLRMYASDADAETPRLDALRRDAILFENFFAQAPWTKPTFASMFTGLYPTEHGLIGKASKMSPRVETLAERLLDAGYYTQGFPNNTNIVRAYGFDKGFVGYEYLAPNMPFFSTPSVAHLELYQVLRRFRARLQLPRVDIDSFYQPAPVVNETVKNWIDRTSRSNRPFFLFFHYMDTHDPYISADTPPRGYAMMHLGLQPDLDEYGDRMRDAYIDEIERIDRHCGEIMDFLESEGLYNDSLIIFVADHGEEFFDHGGWWHGLTHYDELLHIPLLIKLPGNQRAGETNTYYGSQIDLAPTILEVLRLPPSERMSGEALIDADGEFLNEGISHVFAESNFAGAKIRSVRDSEMKYIRALTSPYRKLEPVGLFDLRADPREQNNLAGRQLPKETELRAWLDDTKARLRPGGRP